MQNCRLINQHLRCALFVQRHFGHDNTYWLLLNVKDLGRQRKQCQHHIRTCLKSDEGHSRVGSKDQSSSDPVASLSIWRERGALTKNSHIPRLSRSIQCYHRFLRPWYWIFLQCYPQEAMNSYDEGSPVHPSSTSEIPYTNRNGWHKGKPGDNPNQSCSSLKEVWLDEKVLPSSLWQRFPNR